MHALFGAFLLKVLKPLLPFAIFTTLGQTYILPFQNMIKRNTKDLMRIPVFL